MKATLQIEVEFDFNYIPASRGRREYRGGPGLEPDSPAEIDLVSVRLAGHGPRCKDVEIYDCLTKEQLNELREAAHETVIENLS